MENGIKGEEREKKECNNQGNRGGGKKERERATGIFKELGGNVEIEEVSGVQEMKVEGREW